MKNEDYKHYVGIDVSKSTLDLALYSKKEMSVIDQICIDNGKKGLKGIKKWFSSHGLQVNEAVFCMESTGVYNEPTLKYLQAENAFIWMEMPVRIIRSMGLQRGKNDKVDAKRIAIYAAKNAEQKQEWIAPTKQQQILTDLIALRRRLLNAKRMLAMPINELKAMEEIDRSKLINSELKGLIEIFDKRVESVQKRIQMEMKKDKSIEKNVKLMISIPGIGLWTALAFISTTNNFMRMLDGKQLACHCGCAPFEHTSGSSVRGRTRVSKMANNDMKTILTLGAVSILNSKNELGEYYRRKVAEGKNKMSVINAVRNKLIHRVVAIIKKQEPYQPILTLS